MLTTVAIVDRLNEWKGWSDYRCAQMLEVSHQAIQHWRKKGGVMKNETALKAAEILGLPEEVLLASIELERSLNTPAEAAQGRILGVVESAYKDQILAAERAQTTAA